MKKRTEPFTEEEIMSLKKELRSSYLTAMTIFLMVYILFHLFYFVKTEKWILPNFEFLLLFLLLALTFSLTKLFTRLLRNEIQTGNKLIEYKTVEDKIQYQDKQDRFSKEITKYVIIADSMKFIVTEDIFNKTQISDYLIVHKTPLREDIIHLGIENHQPITSRQP